MLSMLRGGGDCAAPCLADYCVNPKPGTRTPEPGTGNSNPGTLVPESWPRDRIPGTRNPEPGTRNPQPATGNQDPCLAVELLEDALLVAAQHDGVELHRAAEAHHHIQERRAARHLLRMIGSDRIVSDRIESDRIRSDRIHIQQRCAARHLLRMIGSDRIISDRIRIQQRKGARARKDLTVLWRT